MEPAPGSPHGRHFVHCYVYEGSFCSCGGNYQGPDARPQLDLPPRPFNLVAPQRVSDPS
ncbi:hypothetical protein ACWEGQ_00025 [Streptomyces seoulensis]